ncbi:MAG: WD40 repeat domain-containing protein [Verrucomicrobia bacterium]|nr:WD40 repeat domain-containing protein [Verrucomicrobiota bacterium]
MIFFSDGTGTGEFWSLSQWVKTAEFQLDRTEIRCAAFSADGKWLAVGTQNQGWVVIESATGKVLVSVPGAHEGQVRSVAFARDGRRLLTASDDRTAKLWELKVEVGPVVRAEERRTFSGHSAALTSAAFVPGERQILTGSQDGSAKLWDCDFSNDAVIFEDAGTTAKVTAISPDGRYVLSFATEELANNRTRYHPVRLWDARTGKRLTELPEQAGFITSLGFTPDSRLAILRSRALGIDDQHYSERVVGLWNIAASQPVTSFPALTNVWASVAFSPDGKRLYTGSVKESSIWNVETGQRIAVLKDALLYLGYAAFSPDGHRLAARFGSGGDSNTLVAQKATGIKSEEYPALKVWDADTGAELATYRGSVLAFTMLPDSRTALSQDFSAGIIWDLDSGGEVRKIGTGPGVFSPDFRRLCGTGGEIKVLDFESGKVVSTLRGHSDRSHPSGFSPDGRRVWTSSANGTAKLWDADTGRELFSLKTGIGMEAKPMFSADGQNVLLIANGRAQLLPAQSWK